MVTVTVSKTSIVIRGHAETRVGCARVSVVAFMLKERALEWTAREYPRPTVTEFYRKDDDLERAALRVLIDIATTWPRDVRVVTR